MPPDAESHSPRSNSVLVMLDRVKLDSTLDSAEVMTTTVTLPPADVGTPPHRHSGPVFGYVLEGEIVLEVEGDPERIIRAGEPFWEPGGDVIHYQAANNLVAAWSRFVMVMMVVPGEPMLTPVSMDELAQRRHLRAPRPT